MKGYQVLLVLFSLLSLAIGQSTWVVQANYNDSSCQTNLVDYYVQEIGACLSLTADYSTMYTLDGSGNINFFFCSNGNCSTDDGGCYNLGVEPTNVCKQTPTTARQAGARSAKAQRGVADIPPYQMFTLSNGFPASLMNKAEIIVEYKDPNACAGDPNEIIITPGDCYELCYQNILASCSIPKGLNATQYL